MARRKDPGTPMASGQAAQGEPVDDGALVARAGRGDATAFGELVQRHLGAVVATARRLLRDDAAAEDIAQETMLRLWRLGAKLTIDEEGARPWLRRVATNLSIDRIRLARREYVTDEVPEQAVAATQIADIDARDVAARVEAALKALPERQRLALTLFHYEGRSQIDVGKALGVSDEAVESLLARARRSLRVALKDEWRELVEDGPGS